MKKPKLYLYVWEGDGVLQEYGTGLIIAVAPTLESAVRTVKEAIKFGQFPEDKPSEVHSIENQGLAGRVWFCWGSC